MTSRQKRHLRQRLAAHVENERVARGNGGTLDDLIPGDIAERMTKPKPPLLLYQVMVEQCATGLPLPVGPAWSETAAGRFAEAIRNMIQLGRERDWANPIVVPVFAGQRERISAADLVT